MAQVPLHQLTQEYATDREELRILEQALLDTNPVTNQPANSVTTQVTNILEQNKKDNAILRVINITLIALLVYMLLNLEPALMLFEKIPNRPIRLGITALIFAILLGFVIWITNVACL